MPVQNVECQIAEMQIGRYLSGEQFSTEAVRQLEEHVARCARCASILADRKAALKAMLKKEPRAVVAVPDRPTKAADENPLLSAIKAKSNAWAVKKPAPTPAPVAANTPAKKTFSKPLILSGALALVLVGMSYFSRSQDSIFGKSVDQALPKKAKSIFHSKTPQKASVLATPPAKTPLRDDPTAESTVGESPSQAGTTPSNPAEITPKFIKTSAKALETEPEPNVAEATDTSTSQVDENANEQTTAPATSHRTIRRKGSAPAKRSPKRATTHHRIATPAPRPHRAATMGVRVSSSIKVYSPDGSPIQ